VIAVAELLAERAREIVPGTAYHAWLTQALARGRPLPYELVVPERGEWEALRERLFGPFFRTLKRRGFDPEAPPADLDVVAFAGTRCLVLGATTLRDLYAEREGLGRAALHFRVLRHLAGSETTAAPPSPIAHLP
jgi:hypothetical protein